MERWLKRKTTRLPYIILLYMHQMQGSLGTVYARNSILFCIWSAPYMQTIVFSSGLNSLQVDQASRKNDSGTRQLTHRSLYVAHAYSGVRCHKNSAAATFPIIYFHSLNWNERG